jgi:ArsR family transcriptional regulator
LEEKIDYTDFEKNLAHFARALGHPARIAVLIEIAKKGFVIRGENIEVPQLSQATVLQHLRELKRAGILQGRIFGAKSEYKLDLENLRKFDENFHAFMEHFKKPYCVRNGTLTSQSNPNRNFTI